MSDTPDSSPNNRSGPSKEEIKREIKLEIAAAIQGEGDKSREKSDARPDPKSGKPNDQDGNKNKEPEAKPKFKWTPLKVLAVAVVALAVLIIGTIYFVYAATHESTDDAYTAGYVHLISSRVTGNVTQLLIVDNQRVRQGDVLVQLDPTDYLVQVAKAQANYDRAKADFDRVDALKDDVAISKQDYDQTKTNMDVAKANLDDARDQLGYCTIVAPSDGYIGNRTVNVGDRVTVGGALMAVVQDVWVVANYKETQIGKMKKNQPVKIVVDAIPNHTFTGHVDSFAPGTGSTFALLPPDNATGNFTKIVQRVPVKIYFEPDSIKDFRSRIYPGLSVETYVSLDSSVQPTDDQQNKAGQ
jgi:membrane fusion protein (multidrug efflux system)